MSEFNFATISRGVAAGAMKPNQTLVVISGWPSSMKVATSGIMGRRFALPVASGRSRPLFTCGISDEMPANSISTWPPIVSVIAGALPL